MTIRTQAERLWQEEFGDSESYVRDFFELYYKEDSFFYTEHDGVLQTMFFATPYTLRLSGKEYAALYLSGVCTAKPFRGKGLMKQHLVAANFGAAKTNQTSNPTDPVFVFLIAANKGLIPFYEQFGFEKCYSHEQAVFFTCDCGALDTASAMLKESNSLNFALYQRLTRQRDNAVLHTERTLFLYNKGGYRFFTLQRPSKESAIAIVKKENGRLFVLDLAAENPMEERVLLQLLSEKYRQPVVYPKKQFGETQIPKDSPYMVKPIGTSSLFCPKELYFNLLLDK